MITVSTLNDITRLRHGFFTRDGGVSEGLYASLNCGFGSRDEPRRVAANRARAMRQLGRPAESLVTVRQEHTARVVEVTEPFTHDAAPTADAMVTRVPGIALGVLTADCAPVLIADAKAGVIAAIHAGWRGALDGVLENAVAAMAAIGADRARMVAAVGPCIAQRSYEVGPEFPGLFVADDEGNFETFFAPAPRAGHFLFDLASYVARRLSRCGVTDVLRTPCDTFQEETRFFSYRRARLRGEEDYGRQLSAIVLER